MSEFQIEKTAGVGAFMVCGNEFLGIQEGRPKRKTGKLRGMWSLPMETVKDGEAHSDALIRLWQEEITPGPENNHIKLEDKLCVVQFTPGVWLHSYVFESTSCFPAALGSSAGEILGVRWISLSEVLNDPIGSLRFRPGVYETVLSYSEYQSKMGDWSALRFPQTRVQVPSKVYDLIESGISQNEVLLHFGLTPPS